MANLRGTNRNRLQTQTRIPGAQRKPSSRSHAGPIKDVWIVPTVLRRIGNVPHLIDAAGLVVLNVFKQSYFNRLRGQI